MKSARIKGYGSTRDVIEIDQNTPAPNDPSDGKVLVRVKAAGVNPTDWKISEGYMQQIMPIEFPTTLGWDFSGVVEKAGGGVSDIKQGEVVYGQSSVVFGGSGTFAEMALANADNIARKPITLSHEEALVFPLWASALGRHL